MEDLILDALVALSVPTTIFVVYAVLESRKLSSFDDVFTKKKEEEDPRVKASKEDKTISGLKEEGRWASERSDGG
jgi:hypothetical protein